uniref:DUF3810 domain-containing protein n=1 Tax=Elaeophora elaphi TaxID=1147741 RepID=A0A0R3RHE4_9BILA
MHKRAVVRSNVIALLLGLIEQLLLLMCLPELSEDDRWVRTTEESFSDEYDVCCGGLHSYVASATKLFEKMKRKYRLNFVSSKNSLKSLTWSVMLPLFVLYISFLSYLSGPVGLYIGHVLPIAIYYYRIVIMFLFDIIWAVVSSKERKTILDTVLTVLWFLTAFTYFIGWYVHRKTYKFFSTRWAGYDDGDLIFAAKLRTQGLPVTACNMREYFASINLEHESARQHKEQLEGKKD